jgi:hypothetical protein
MGREWIEVNLPYCSLPDGQEEKEPNPPNMNRRIKAKFGKTYKQCDLLCRETLEKVCTKINDVEEKNPPPKDETYEQRMVRRRQMIERLMRKRNPEAADNYVMMRAIEDWQDQHPVMLAWSTTCDGIREWNRLRTFQGQGLAKPGVQVEMEDGKKYLIGDINANRGVCDDCTVFEREAIVLRYRVLIEDLA